MVTHFVGDVDNVSIVLTSTLSFITNQDIPEWLVAFYSTLAHLGFTLDGFLALLLYLGPMCIFISQKFFPFNLLGR